MVFEQVMPNVLLENSLCQMSIMPNWVHPFLNTHPKSPSLDPLLPHPDHRSYPNAQPQPGSTQPNPSTSLHQTRLDPLFGLPPARLLRHPDRERQHEGRTAAGHNRTRQQHSTAGPKQSHDPLRLVVLIFVVVQLFDGGRRGAATPAGSSRGGPTAGGQGSSQGKLDSEAPAGVDIPKRRRRFDCRAEAGTM